MEPPANLPDLTLEILQESISGFVEIYTSSQWQELFGVTDGKAIGAHLESQFKQYLIQSYNIDSAESSENDC